LSSYCVAVIVYGFGLVVFINVKCMWPCRRIVLQLLFMVLVLLCLLIPLMLFGLCVFVLACNVFYEVSLYVCMSTFHGLEHCPFLCPYVLININLDLNTNVAPSLMPTCFYIALQGRKKKASSSHPISSRHPTLLIPPCCIMPISSLCCRVYVFVYYDLPCVSCTCRMPYFCTVCECPCSY